MIEQEVRMVRAFVHEALDEAEIEGGVAAGLHRDPLVRLRHRAAEMGVDDDELRARVLGVGDVLPHLDLGIDGVGAHEQDVVGIHEILGFALIEPLDAATREAGVRRRVERVVPFRAAERIEQAHDEARVAVERALGSATALIVGVGERPVLRLDLFPFGDDLVYRLFPRDALPFAAAAGRAVDAAHRILDARIQRAYSDARIQYPMRASE